MITITKSCTIFIRKCFIFYLYLFLIGGMASFPILVNSVVHIVMYSYYQISTMGPQYHKYASKFKKYVTIIQLVNICTLTKFKCLGKMFDSKLHL